MKLEHVEARVAVERMWIYAKDNSVTEKETLTHTLLSGQAITYLACDTFGKPISRTRVVPENNPVTLVTEYDF